VISLELDLDVYLGPFDLLLTLVLKEEIDLLEVPLLDVILAYLERMDEQGAGDYWDEMTEFLLLMSLLVEVKSRLLLPGAVVELEEDLSPAEAREQFLARLYEYSKFRTAADELRRRAEANRGALYRKPEREPHRRLAPLDQIAGSEDVMTLRERLLKLMDSKREPDTSHVAQIRVDLQRQIRIVRGVLAKHGRFSFEAIFGGEEPLVQAVSLFALLDLLARGEIRVSQAHTFGDIVVRTSRPRASV
jgi:segregation and condensation protein A